MLRVTSYNSLQACELIVFITQYSLRITRYCLSELRPALLKKLDYFAHNDNFYRKGFKEWLH